MIFITLSYLTIYGLSIFGGFELIKICVKNNDENNDENTTEIIDLNKLTIEDVSKMKQIIDPSNNKLKEKYPIHDIIEEIDVEILEKNLPNNQHTVSHLPHWTGNFKPRAFF
tara:strand:+ start:910 stop:1245 length:336 start_codon:yes stop_codon:yes gene_type:complete